MPNTYTDKMNLRIPTLGDTGWNTPLDDDIEIIDTTVAPVLAGNVVLSGCVPSDGGVLTVDYTGGTVVVDGSEYAITSGSKTATVSSKNWLYVDDAGAVQISTTAPTGDYALLALADADATALTNVADLRNMAEGAAALDLSYTPDNYLPDTGESKEIEQHLAGIDTQIGFMGGFKNQFINGGFDVWQRGTSQTSSGYGSDDRWHNWFYGITSTHQQVAFLPGQTDVPRNPKYYSRTVPTLGTAASDNCIKRQRIEGAGTLSGQTATLSFYAKADASKNIAIEFVQNFGTGGSPSTEVTEIAVTTITLSTTWAKYTVTATLPSISGKTIGTSNDDYLEVRIWYSGGSASATHNNSLGNQAGTFDLAQAQLEAGDVPTPFEQRNVGGAELALCQRYFEKSFGPNITPQNYPDTSNVYDNTNACALIDGKAISGLGAMGGGIGYNVTKRDTPTIVFYGDSAGKWLESGGATNKQMSVYGTICNGVHGFVPVQTNGYTWNYLRGHWTSTAEL